MNYFLPAFFAAQKAFNLADNFALVAELMVDFLGLAAGLTERLTDLAATLFFSEALVVGFFFDAAPGLAEPLRIRKSSTVQRFNLNLRMRNRTSSLEVTQHAFAPADGLSTAFPWHVIKLSGSLVQDYLAGKGFDRVYWGSAWICSPA